MRLRCLFGETLSKKPLARYRAAEEAEPGGALPPEPCAYGLLVLNGGRLEKGRPGVLAPCS